MNWVYHMWEATMTERRYIWCVWRSGGNDEGKSKIKKEEITIFYTFILFFWKRKKKCYYTTKNQALSVSYPDIHKQFIQRKRRTMNINHFIIVFVSDLCEEEVCWT